MSYPDNEERAERAARVLDFYKGLKHTDPEFLFRDLLSDLRHFADQSEDLDYYREDDAAEVHFLAEKEEELEFSS